jgi:DNA topoisomerase-2
MTTKYQKLEQREHVLLRPDTYIGTVRYQNVDRFVAEFVPVTSDISALNNIPNESNESNENNAEEFITSTTNSVVKTKDSYELKIIEKNVSFCTGLVQLFLEILNNARDRTVVTDVESKCNKIDVQVDESTGEISIQNNGDSIPVEIHAKEKIYIPELIFGHLLTSSNYDDSERRIVGGRNGYGAKLTNIYSSRFSVELVDAKTRQRYSQTWYNNMTRCDPPVITQLSAKNPRPYTKISWIFDHARFGKTNVIDADFLSIVRKAVVDVAATVGNKVTVTFQGREILCDSLQKYMDVFPALTNAPTKIHAVVNDRWKIALSTVDPSVGHKSFSFVNGIWTWLGGTHESYVVNQIVDCISGILRKRVSADERSLVENARNLNKLIKDRIWVFVDSCIENPAFSAQTKGCLETPRSEWGSTCELPPAFVKKLGNLEILEMIMDQLRGKSQSALRNTDGRKVQRLLGIEKYDSAPWAGGAKSQRCLLIITEGDSAKGTAVAGLKARNDRERFGIFPLRGKVLNVRNASPADLQKNEEFKHLKQILGLQQGKTYESEADRKTLRYGGLIVFTDQDTDGFHIKALVMNIFATFWPHLLETGFVQCLPTPIVKATKGKELVQFYSIPEFKQWEASLQTTKGWNIKYYKGLGTSTSDEAKEYFKNFRTVQYVSKEFERKTSVESFFGKVSEETVTNSNSEPTTLELMVKMFDSSETDYRKTWVQGYNRDSALDPKRARIPIDEFIHNEYIHHANDNLERTLPCVIDGLKPSQRKIIYGCFEEGLHDGRKEMKVAQLGAAVARVSQYHHGEVSLMSAIVNMAQTFVGSNNMNLLVPSGQFGTRLLGGKDAASARYIFTRLSDFALTVFKKEDNPILEYVNDEGKQVEPTTYIPVIPMVLINGADGIGTGFSTTLPPSNPRVVIENIRRMISMSGIPLSLQNNTLEPYVPWWNKFKGSVQKVAESKYVVEGVYSIDKPGFVHITELPIGTWTSNYKTYLDSLVLEGKILDHTSLVDDEYVDITVQMNTGPEQLSSLDQEIERLEGLLNETTRTTKKRKADEALVSKLPSIPELLKLQTKVSVSNVHLFTSPYPKENARSYIKKYASIEDVYREFYETRRAAYIARKNYQLSVLQHDHTVASARVVFIDAKLDGRLVLENRMMSDVVTDLHSLQLPEMNGNYDYLLDMKISSLTRERVEYYKRVRDDLVVKIEELTATTIENIWLREILEIETLLA